MILSVSDCEDTLSAVDDQYPHCCCAAVVFKRASTWDYEVDSWHRTPYRPLIRVRVSLTLAGAVCETLFRVNIQIHN